MQQQMIALLLHLISKLLFAPYLKSEYWNGFPSLLHGLKDGSVVVSSRRVRFFGSVAEAVSESFSGPILDVRRVARPAGSAVIVNYQEGVRIVGGGTRLRALHTRPVNVRVFGFPPLPAVKVEELSG